MGITVITAPDAEAAHVADQGLEGLDYLRVLISACGDIDELRYLALCCLGQAEPEQQQRALEHSAYKRLLAAARASIAADRDGLEDPLAILRHQLGINGQLPPSQLHALQILADAADTADAHGRDRHPH